MGRRELLTGPDIFWRTQSSSTAKAGSPTEHSRTRATEHPASTW